MNLFELFVKIGVDDQASNNLSNITDKLGNGLKKAAQIGTAAITAAAAGIAALTKAAVDNYAEYEQLVGGVETLFKDSADTVKGYADGAFRSAGLSANEYMSTVTSFAASLIQSLGGNTQEAADYAQMAITDMADNANKMGSSIDSIQVAYQGFAKQQYNLLDNLKLGYGGTQAEMYRLLKDAQKIDETFDAVFSLDDKGHLTAGYADIVKAIHIVQTEMGITGTTAKEASETISGSVASMKAAWQNLITAFADENQNFDNLMDRFVSSTSTALNNLLPRIEKALNGISKLIGKSAPIIVKQFPALIKTILDGLLKSATDIVIAVSDVLPDIIELIVPIIAEQAPRLIKAGYELMSTLMASLVEAFAKPEIVSSIASAVKQIAAIMIARRIDMVKTAIELIQSLASGFVENFGAIKSKIAEFVGKAADFVSQNASAFIESAKEILSAIGTGIVDNAKNIIGNVKEFLLKVVDFVSTNAPILLDAALALVKSIGSYIVENAENMIGNIKEFLGKIGDFIIENIPLLVDGAVSIAQGISNFVVEKADVIIPQVKKFLGKIGDFLKTNVPLLVDAALNIVGSIGSYIAENAKEIVSGINDFMSKIVAFFTNTENLKQLTTAAIDIILGLVTGITTNAIKMLPAVVELIAAIAVALTDPEVLSQLTTVATGIIMGLAGIIIKILSDTAIIEKLVESATQILEALGEAIGESLPILVNAAVEIITNLIKFLSSDDNTKKLIEGAIAIVLMLSRAFIDNAGKLASGVNQLAAEIITALFEIDWWQVGKDIATSITDGFNRGISDLFDAADEAGLLPDWAINPFGSKYSTNYSKGRNAKDALKSYGVTINQNIYSQAQTAADLAQETQWEARRTWISEVEN